jgi:mannose-6-phosphate isomerase-like protein (cupin superfamily)
MANFQSRRVVTGLNAAGKSCVIIDGAVPDFATRGLALAWATHENPADNSGSADPVEPYRLDMLHRPGSNFALCTFTPGSEAFMHATDTIDYLVIIMGHVTLVLEEEEVRLGPGDLVVDRGVMHAWRNDDAVPCVAAVVNLPSLAVGAGRTI